MSSFSWVAFSDDERERTLDIIAQFQDRDTRDELGIGRIRDAFADMLFPGTSTIQTRARYFLFIPWMYQELERKRVPSSEVSDRVERYENRLIDALVQSGDTDGVIGKQARSDLQCYPSDIYWRGLWIWNIRQFEGSRAKYDSALDDFYTLLERQQRTDTADTVGVPLANWDKALPDPPSSFPKEASLTRLSVSRLLVDKISRSKSP